LNQLCAKYDRHQPAFKEQDLRRLRQYAFPGNVRELRNLLERSLLRTDKEAAELQMDLDWLPAGSTGAPGSNEAFLPGTPGGEARILSALEQQEYELIARTLVSENGGIRRTAAKLGLTHQALLRRLQKWPELRHAAGCSE
jgi:DNA-binding NtrC family response regulator